MKIENGYFIWNKGDNLQISAHFHTREFDCQCLYPECVEQRVSVLLIRKLELVREDAKTPLDVTSGFRCGPHQADLRGMGFETAKKKSTHEKGDAADVGTGDPKGLEPLVRKQFKSLGVGKSMIHVDIRDEPHYWTYQFV